MVDTVAIKGGFDQMEDDRESLVRKQWTQERIAEQDR